MPDPDDTPTVHLNRESIEASASDSSGRALRVLIVSQHFWPEPLRINDVAASLVEAGCGVTVLTGKPNYPNGRIFPGYRVLSVQHERHGGCHIVRVPLVPRGRGAAWRLATNYLSFVVCACLLGPAALRRERFDVVFVYGTSPILQAIAALWLKTLRGVPVITWVQDLWPESLAMTGYIRNSLALRAVGQAVRWIYRRSDLVLVQSMAFLGPVRDQARPTPVQYQPNPGECVTLHPDAPATAALTLKPGFRILFAGNLGTVQALETVIEAARLTGPASGIRWVLVGSGAKLAWLQEQIRAAGLEHVDVPGRVEAHDMPGILAQADVLLVSLIGGPAMNLTVPSKVQTYLAAGKPILASIDGEGARVVEESGAGLVCRAQDAHALAAAAMQLRSMPVEQRISLGRRGRAYYEKHYASELVARQLIDRFREVVSPTAAQ
jgi:glycosyltransferase involved in cell wall biosynthesis